MKSSGLLKWLVIPVLLLAVFAAVRLLSHQQAQGTSNTPVTGKPLSADEMKALGIGGDTTQDTLATLVAQLKQLREELKSAKSENQQQRTENERLRNRETAINQHIESTLAAERDKAQTDRDQVNRQQQQTQSLLEDLERRLNNLATQSSQADLPVGLGLRKEDAKEWTGRLQWLEPEDRLSDGHTRHTATSAGTSSSVGSNDDARFPTSFPLTTDAGENANAPAAHAAETDPRVGETTATKPVYTVPANSTLVNSVAMTALIGRVPIDGTVHDPYPFKVVIGPDNLTANGIELPELAGAVASGTASGDWTQSCVRGRINSITFVFNDDTVRTVSASAASSHDSAAQGGLGWISDEYGIPCVSGERHSNAEQYLGAQSLITAAGAGAASLIKSDRSALVTSNGNILGTVGLSTQDAMGRILANGVQELSDWVNKLYGQAFAAIYVQPGARVALHIEQPLTIDYDTHGRRVHHNLGDVHDVPDLD